MYIVELHWQPSSSGACADLMLHIMTNHWQSLRQSLCLPHLFSLSLLPFPAPSHSAAGNWHTCFCSMSSIVITPVGQSGDLFTTPLLSAASLAFNKKERILCCTQCHASVQLYNALSHCRRLHTMAGHDLRQPALETHLDELGLLPLTECIMPAVAGRPFIHGLQLNPSSPNNAPLYGCSLCPYTRTLARHVEAHIREEHSRPQMGTVLYPVYTQRIHYHHEIFRVTPAKLPRRVSNGALPQAPLDNILAFDASAHLPSSPEVDNRFIAPWLLRTGFSEQVKDCSVPALRGLVAQPDSRKPEDVQQFGKLGAALYHHFDEITKSLKHVDDLILRKVNSWEEARE